MEVEEMSLAPTNSEEIVSIFFTQFYTLWINSTCSSFVLKRILNDHESENTSFRM